MIVPSIHKILWRLKRRILPKRTPRDELLRRLPSNAIGAEIGVWKGEFSIELLRRVKPSQFHLIDPWAFQGEFPDRWYGGKLASSQHDMDLIYRSVVERFASYPNVIVHRGFSDSVLAEFGDAYFDWVYIDGNHYYEYVFADLELSYAKVKPGGLITGDDYAWGESDGYPVKRAVADFAAKHDLEDSCSVFGSQFLIQR